MRKAFIEYDEVEAIMNRMDCEEEDAVFIIVPWAAVCKEVDGGYMAFESVDDCKTWMNQR